MKNIEDRKKIKRKIFLSESYNLEAIENFLEQMASNGWMFTKVNNFFYTFEKCEPIKLKFQVDVFGKGKIDDNYSLEKTIDYIEYCEEAGWKYVFSLDTRHFFYSENNDVVSIQTDDEIKLKMLFKSTLIKYVLGWILIPLLLLLSYIYTWWEGLSEIETYYDYAKTFAIANGTSQSILFSCFLLIGIIILIRLLVFYTMNKKRIKNGLKIKYYSITNRVIFSIINISIYTIGDIFILIALALLLNLSDASIGIIIGTITAVALICIIGRKIIYSNNETGHLNFFNAILKGFVTVIVISFISLIFTIAWLNVKDKSESLDSENTGYTYYADDIECTLDDLGATKPDTYLFEETYTSTYGSFLGSRTECSDYCYINGYVGESFGYSIDIFSSRFDCIIDKYNSLVFDIEGCEFTDITDSESEYEFDKVYCVIYDSSTTYVTYVVMEEKTTYVVSGDLSEEQAMELTDYYINN